MTDQDKRLQHHGDLLLANWASWQRTENSTGIGWDRSNVIHRLMRESRGQRYRHAQFNDIESDVAEQTNRLVIQLPEQQRQLIEAVYLYGFPSSRIAAELEVGKSTVNRWIAALKLRVGREMLTKANL